MGVHVTGVCASGEPTSAIPRVQCTADRRRNGARLAPDIERFPLLILHDAHQAGVAREPSSRLRRQRGTVLELTSSGYTLAQRLGIHVNDDLVALPTVERCRSVL